MANVHCIDTVHGASVGSGIRREVPNPFSALVRLVMTWQTRAIERAHLGALDTRLLKDMGIDPVEARREAEKPFWRA